MIGDEAVRVLSESEMEAVVGGHAPPASGDPTGDD